MSHHESWAVVGMLTGPRPFRHTVPRYSRWFRGLKTESRAFSDVTEFDELAELAEESETVESVLLDVARVSGRDRDDFFDLTLSFVETCDSQLHL